MKEVERGDLFFWGRSTFYSLTRSTVGKFRLLHAAKRGLLGVSFGVQCWTFERSEDQTLKSGRSATAPERGSGEGTADSCR